MLTLDFRLHDRKYGYGDIWDVNGARWCRWRQGQQVSRKCSWIQRVPFTVSLSKTALPHKKKLLPGSNPVTKTMFLRKNRKKKYTLYLPNHTASYSRPSWRSDMSVNRNNISEQHTNDIFLHARRWNPWLRRVFITAWRRRGVTCEDSSGSSTCPSEAANCTSNHFNKRQYSSTRTSNSKPAKPSPG